MKTNNENYKNLKKLEESLWLAKTRFDLAYMDKVLSPDFFEFGRSGRIYTREDTLHTPSQEIHVKLPLKDFAVHFIDTNVAQITYVSEVTYGDIIELGNRSSIWIKTPQGWQLRFHQGTPRSK